MAWHIARRPGGLVALAIQYGHMRTALDVRTSTGYGNRSRRGFHGELDVETAFAAAQAAARLREATAAGEKISGLAARRALVGATSIPRFEGALTTPKAAAKFLSRDGLVLFDNPDSFLICAFKRDTALCDPEPGATAPNQFACQLGCGNAVRTDSHARAAREHADRLDTKADHLPSPLETGSASPPTASAASPRPTTPPHRPPRRPSHEPAARGRALPHPGGHGPAPGVVRRVDVSGVQSCVSGTALSPWTGAAVCMPGA